MQDSIQRVLARYQENAWIRQIFEAQAISEGKPVRRSVQSVEQYASHEELLSAVKRRGFHLIRIAEQYLILPIPGPIHTFC